MAEKSDDIKNLFLNLGLNPSDYHEIRSAPSANVTVSEAPRRWSLLQPGAGAKPTGLPIASVASVAAVPVPIIRPAAVARPVAAPAAAPAVPVSSADPISAAVSLPAALLAAAQDIARAEAQSYGLADSPVSLSRGAASVSPPAAAVPTPAEGLQSLFQSVKEPTTVAQRPHRDVEPPTERRTDQLYSRTPAATSPTQRAAALPEARSALLAEPVRPLIAGSQDEPETRHAPRPSRLGPMPVAAASAQASPRQPIQPATAPAESAGRLRFASGVAAAPVSSAGRGDSLQDVFRRLSSHNRS